jgi:hypothetical protein
LATEALNTSADATVRVFNFVNMVFGFICYFLKKPKDKIYVVNASLTQFFKHFLSFVWNRDIFDKLAII